VHFFIHRDLDISRNTHTSKATNFYHGFALVQHYGGSIVHKSMNTLLCFKENQKLPYMYLCTQRNATEENKRWDQGRRSGAGTQHICMCYKPLQRSSACLCWEGLTSQEMSFGLPYFCRQTTKKFCANLTRQLREQ